MAEDKIVAFMQDMAGKYIPGKRTGSDVLELFTTDTGRTYRVRVTPERCELNVPAGAECSARIETTTDAFMDMLSGKLSPFKALLRGKVKVRGDLGMLKALPQYFKA